jgi:hypothetical protein
LADFQLVILFKIIRHEDQTTSVSLFQLFELPLSQQTLDVLSDPNWMNEMHEELENFERNQVCELVEKPPHCKPIGTKWVWKNKDGENGEVVRNKSRLVAQGYSRNE